MKEAKAQLKYARISPQKMRLVVDAVRGSSLAAARTQLFLLPKKGAPILAKLLDSAVSNAKNAGLQEAGLFIKTIFVDPGPMFKRSLPRAHGRATVLRKRTSHIRLILGEKE
ncbi:MAG: 50S ribosomal protein L22 [Candidatus Ryanbacteria bacterium CG10_big_fil_rev_8_21_14_0_10_43_42]|uniref:Large ribosomal subunit protein uL22 n=1 Tax=Candidatus Ryanbacteria bacterium CG10_big_fil_rev_8_21_14_0_10_43_42 TaxID=1974864 RepID=A0A2M8KXZ8_9BACT|nr:MAG: 50S ribosomal protein L22 [Candidatus Ryanbacteria bacterium CG10_big_fil_rev_8_21_14_0_10_43_42]